MKKLFEEEKYDNKLIQFLVDMKDRVYCRLRDTYLTTRCWLRLCANKWHMQLVRTAWCVFPFDFGYMYSLERAQLVCMLEYFKKSHIVVEESYVEMRKWIKILISLLDIITESNGVDLFEYKGDMMFEEIPDSSYYKLNTDNMEYVCKVKVNLKNANRFCRNECELNFVKGHPHELYQKKAKYLYHQIRYRYMETFWD